MTINTNPLKEAVKNFEWMTENKPLEISEPNLNNLVTEIAQKIISASQVRPNIEKLIQKDLSLVQTCYLIAKDLDKKYNTCSEEKIAHASEAEKNILGHVFTKLSQEFTSVEQNNLKAMILALGILKVSEVASSKIETLTPKLNIREDLEANLKNLKALRDKYAPFMEFLDESDKVVINKVDAKILEIEIRIKELIQKEIENAESQQKVG